MNGIVIVMNGMRVTHDLSTHTNHFLQQNKGLLEWIGFNVQKGKHNESN